MDNLSLKQIQQIESLYENIYQEKQETAETTETITEEDFCDILSIEICNALIEAGLLEGEIITETTIKEGKLAAAWNVIKGIVKPVVKQVTGFGTKPTTALGAKVRQGQKLATAAVTGASIVKPEVPQRILNTATGTVTGAVKGGYEGATRPTGGGPITAADRAIRAAKGEAVPAASDKKPNLDLTPQGTIRIRR
jgi:hypothetical protein